MAIRLVLVRHGLSSFNAKGLIQGRTDDSFLTKNLLWPIPENEINNNTSLTFSDQNPEY